ncbi:glycosyltransferase [Nocardia ninae]|uniref:glycosyltransferase n=1 Tax=Nocardia ninae TaxID=356145 RepID=UPI001C9980AA|nr:glycosyltransferase [Nocardia ninae]
MDRLGSPGIPYAPAQSAFWPADRIIETAERLLATVDLNAYDVLSIHYGNLEIEQLLPCLWTRQNRPPAIYHVHCLDWTLFTTHVPNQTLRALVDNAIDTMDGFVFFGDYGRTQLARQYHFAVPSTVSWLPTTIPPHTRTTTRTAWWPAAAPTEPRPVASFYGYAAPWKDLAGLIRACKRTRHPCTVLVAGPLWDDPHQAGTDLSREIHTGQSHGATEVVAVPTYLEPADRLALVQRTSFGVFPYREQPTFQGSGAIADYLAHGIPVLATDIANMAELIGDAGQIVHPGDDIALGHAIDRLSCDTKHRNKLSCNAHRRSNLFSASHHAAQCLQLYDKVIADRTRSI